MDVCRRGYKGCIFGYFGQGNMYSGGGVVRSAADEGKWVGVGERWDGFSGVFLW